MGYSPHSAVGERDFPCLPGGKPAEYQDGGLLRLSISLQVSTGAAAFNRSNQVED